VAFVGAFTALFAASVAITQTEMKKILAYSTVSQLGYMMLALGAGSLSASMFHLMTHAFFKALMFLGAGSVLHAMSNEASIWKYGGLKKYMPITYWTFLVGCLAIAGIFPFAGFFSKDLILEVVYLASSISSYPPTSQYPAFYTMLLVMAFATAMMTAFYMFRMFFICFHGELRDKHAHPHESPFSMTMPLVVLCVLSVCGGWVGWPGLGEGQSFAYFVRDASDKFHVVHANWFLIITSTVLALIGIGGAMAIYLKKMVSHEELAKKFAPLYKLSFNKFYIDEIYLWLIHNVLDALGKFLWWVDITIVDGFIDGIGSSTQMLGNGLRKIQTGKLQHYALIFFAGIVILVLLMSFTDTSSASLGLLGGVR
jgi:NADH-quinone oxidoreductase subunit L